MAQKLLGVVNGLQMLEDNFLKVLMEAALKLASVTDVPVFILCETQEGRRFAGQRDLCNLYRRGTLLPTEADVEMEINVAECELTEKTSGGGGSEDQGHVNEEGGTTTGSPTFIDDANIIPLTMMVGRKRSSDDVSPGWMKNKLSRKAPYRPPHLAAGVSAAAASSSKSTESLQTPPLPPMSLDDQWNWDGLENGMDVKAFPCEMDSDGAVVPYPEPETNGGASSSSHLEKLDRIVERWRPPRPAPKRAASMPSSSLPSPSEFAENGAAFTNFDLKVEALKQIPGQKFEQTNSDEFRLMSSCMYEFGRNTAEKYLERLEHSPDLPHRRFFVQEYEIWAVQFLNIHPFGNVMIKKENRESKRTLTAYMRKIAGDAFGICIRKRLKKLNEYQLKNFEFSNGRISGQGHLDQSLSAESTETFS